MKFWTKPEIYELQKFIEIYAPQSEVSCRNICNHWVNTGLFGNHCTGAEAYTKYMQLANEKRREILSNTGHGKSFSVPQSSVTAAFDNITKSENEEIIQPDMHYYVSRNVDSVILRVPVGTSYRDIHVHLIK